LTKCGCVRVCVWVDVWIRRCLSGRYLSTRVSVSERVCGCMCMCAGTCVGDCVDLTVFEYVCECVRESTPARARGSVWVCFVILRRYVPKNSCFSGFEWSCVVCGEWHIKIRHPMGLRHLVLCAQSITTTRKRFAWCWTVLQNVAMCCIVLKCVAVFCSVLQCVAVCCSVF